MNAKIAHIGCVAECRLIHQNMQSPRGAQYPLRCHYIEPVCTLAADVWNLQTLDHWVWSPFVAPMRLDHSPARAHRKCGTICPN